MLKIILLFVTVSLGLTINGVAQIPNGNFENWNTIGSYDTPVSWDNLNALTAPKNVFTCQRGDIKNVTDAYLKLVSDSVEGMGVVPGIAVCGVLNKTTFKPESGFAYAKRPTALSGKWQFMAQGDDKGFIAVYFTKWNQQTKKRDTIGGGLQALEGMEMSWAPFSIPLSFSNNGNPDSCIILLSASGNTPLQFSYLFVNDLSFEISSGINQNNETGSFKIFPNPALDLLHIDLSGLKEIQSIQVFDSNGEAVYLKPLAPNETSIDISAFSSGMYFICVRTAKGVVTNKFSKP